ncbi:MAG TPA: DinB family protein [Candidatus Limnocylindria bacterium]|nr:DinB family protein [Candidatus Limnocylindria bacterium]
MPQTIRSAYPNWPMVNARLRSAVESLTDDQLLLKPAPDRWPMWATVGHLACQRVFGLCDFAGEPGAGTTPFPNAAWNCPGDDDLENVLGSGQLVMALDSTFAIIESVLDSWTLSSLDEVLRRPEWDDSWVRSRGELMQRTYAHDVWHCAELNDTLGRYGLPPIDIWE